MRFTISSSSRDAIDDSYKTAAINLLNYLVKFDDAELNWGSGSYSIMGLSYKVFLENNKKIYGYTTKKYLSDLENLKGATHQVFDTTFDLKREIFNDADVIICLAGGTGTVSEFFSYLEEIRSNESDKLLIVYDENNHFDITLKLIDDLIERKFNDDSIYDCFKVVRNIEELEKLLKENGKI